MLVIFSANRKPLILEGKKKEEEESEWREEVLEEQQNITARYEIGCPIFTFHYT
jgi:hypothetical protein